MCQNYAVQWSLITIVQCQLHREIKPKQGKEHANQKKQMKESPKMVIGKSSEVKDLRMKPIPGYDQIFKPPSRIDRDPSKKYGKEALRVDFNSQYHTFMSNKRLLKDWLQEAGFYASAPNLKSDMEAKMALKKLISLKHSNLAAFNFDSITMRWQEKDIYATAKSMLQYSRKADGRNHMEVGGEESNSEDSHVESHSVGLDTRAALRYVLLIPFLI